MDVVWKNMPHKAKWKRERLKGTGDRERALLQGSAVPTSRCSKGARACDLVPLLRSCGSVLIQKPLPAVPGKTILVPACLWREQCWSHGAHLQERCSLFMEKSLSAVRKDLFLWECIALTETMQGPHKLPPLLWQV